MVDLSAFQGPNEPDEPQPKTRRPKRVFVLGEDGSSETVLWSPIPDWVQDRLIEIEASASAFALAWAIGRLIRERGGENPTTLYARRSETLAYIPQKNARALALSQLEKAGVVKRVGLKRGRASLALALWLPRKGPPVL